MLEQQPQSLRAEYSKLESIRNPYLMRAQDASRFTLPYLIPPAGTTGSSKLKTTFSSFGARCVNSLASKVVLAMLPPQAPFFKYVIDDIALMKVSQDPQLHTEIDKALAAMESRVVDEIETTASRTPTHELVKHAIVAGNCLGYLTETNHLRIFPLYMYVVKRDGQNHVCQVVLKEAVSPMTVPESIRNEALDKAGNDLPYHGDSAEKTLELYTGIFRRETYWEVWQEVSGVEVPGSRNKQPLDACPWFVVRWTPVDGEDYGRGLVEEYLGDLISHEGLSASLVKGAAASAKIVYLRNPNGTTKASALTRAETGSVIDGKEEDIRVLQSDKRLDFDTVRHMLADLKEQLSYAFAMNQAIQRNAERVTAEEIRFMANELDSLLGGIYSLLSLEFQLPYLRRLTSQLERGGHLPTLPKNVVKPVIVTGVAALGRGADLENLKAFVADVVALGGPQALQTYINFDDLMKRLSTARGIKADGLVKSADEVAQEQKQQQMQAMVQQLGPNAVNALGGMAKQSMANNQPTPSK